MSKLVGFGRACAPVRCAHPSFWAHKHAKRDAAGLPVQRSFAASSLSPKNQNNLFPETKCFPSGPNSGRQGRISFHSWSKLHPTELRCALFWATLNPVELRCTLLNYAAFNWAMLHPIWAMMHPKSYGSSSEISCTLLCFASTLSELRCTLSELRCALRATVPLWAKLRPSELCCTLLRYAAPFRATLHPTELRHTLNELRGTLKINGPCSADPSAEFIDKQRKPRKISRNKMLLFRPELGLPGAYIFPLYHWDLYRKTQRKITGWAPASTGPARLKNIMSPGPCCHHSCADPSGYINYM